MTLALERPLWLLALVAFALVSSCRGSDFGDVQDAEELQHPWEKETLDQHMKDERLFHACVDNDVEQAKIALKIGAHHHHHKNGYTPLMQATWMGHANIVEVLLDAGAHYDQLDAFGRTSLMIAAINGHYDAGKLLVDAGADLYIKKRDTHETALRLAESAANHPDASEGAPLLAEYIRKRMSEAEEARVKAKKDRIEKLKNSSTKKSEL